MNELEEFRETNEEVVYAEDTALPKDLAEILQLQKQQRQETLFTRKKILTFFMGWTFHATGIAIAKWCLIIGGSSALWMAATLCFTVAFVPTSFLISGININYIDGQLQVSDMQKAGNFLIGLVTSSVTTYLAIRENKALIDLSNQTVIQVSEDIRTIQKQYPQTDPWLSPAIAILVLLAGILALSLANRR